MKARTRILTALAGLFLVAMYLFPIWSIELEAPQYPEGIGMYVTIDNIVGHEEFDLRNINNLNHYIGMKVIVPGDIPELVYMPWIIGFLIGFALLTAIVGKRWMLLTWLGIFVLISIVGLVDFWLWEYDYGHNLDMVHAIIKIPGMSYQPPLIGSKQLLNFTAHSWPSWGGWAAFVSMGLGAFAFWKDRD